MPAAIRQALGLTPGSKIVWRLRGDDVIVRRAARYTSQDLHDAVFDTPTAPRTVEEMKEGIRSHVRQSHAPR